MILRKSSCSTTAPDINVWNEKLKKIKRGRKIRNYIVVFCCQYVAGGFHWESSFFIYSSKYLHTFRVFFHFLKISLKTAQVSQGCWVLFFLLAFCCSFTCNVQLNQAMSSARPPPNRSDEDIWDRGFAFLRVLRDTHVLDHHTHCSRDCWRVGSFPVPVMVQENTT